MRSSFTDRLLPVIAVVVGVVVIVVEGNLMIIHIYKYMNICI